MRFHGCSRSGLAGFLRTVFVTIMILAGPLARVEAASRMQGGDGETIFGAKSAACHTIGGGPLVGPDLKDVTARRDMEWLKSFIADPNELFAANDPLAHQLLAESNNVKMPALGLTAAEVDAVVAYLHGASPAAESAAPAPQPAAPAGDPASGQLFFTGEKGLAEGGPSCISCHTVSSIGGLGGGTLGPDLTHAAQRYPGAALSSVLGNIAFPTMIGPYNNRALTPQEQADLVAFLVEADQDPAAAADTAAGAGTGSVSPQTWRLLGLGLVGAVALTVLLAFFWPRQRQSVSARLRAQAKTEEV